MLNFIRQAKLILYFRSQQGPGFSSKREYFSDGSRKGLRIQFQVVKTLTSSPNESSVTISNLSPESRQIVISQIENVYAELYVGYQSRDLQLLTSGDLVRAFPEKQGTENLLTLSFLDGASAIFNAATSRSFPAGMPIKDVVFEIAKEFEKDGVTVDASKINIPGQVDKGGMPVCGRTATILDRLSASYRFTWSIQNGVFQAFKDVSDKKEPSRKVFEISFKKRNLIKSIPELGEKFMQQTGMKIDAILEPLCSPGDIILLESHIYPQYSGRYVAMNVDYYGDTFGADWKMSIDSKTIVKVAGE